MRRSEKTRNLTLSRRRFIQGVTAVGVATLVEGTFSQAQAETTFQSPSVLAGNHFDLTIEEHYVDFTGRRAKAIKVNGSLPAPTLKWREGDTVTIAVTNHLSHDTSIHWRGLRIPAPMDGVPGLSFAGIPPGKTFAYRFPVLQNGTYWHHSHSGFQEQLGLWGALVIEPRDEDPIAYDREYVVLLSDWSDTAANILYRNLKKQSDYYNFHKRTAGTFIKDAKNKGLGPTISDEDAAYTIFAQPESRGRYARGTLAPRMGMTAEIPPMDPFPLRTMADMCIGRDPNPLIWSYSME